MAARIDEFLIGVKPQREWGWLVISYLFLGGAGAGLFLISLGSIPRSLLRRIYFLYEVRHSRMFLAGIQAKL